MFRAVAFIHIVGATALAIYMSYFWLSTSVIPQQRLARTQICKMFSSCTFTTKTTSVKTTQKTESPSNPCHTYPAYLTTCTGSTRCCYDCTLAGTLFLYGNFSRDSSRGLSIKFFDTSDVPKKVLSCLIVVYVSFYLVLVITRHVCNTRNKEKPLTLSARPPNSTVKPDFQPDDARREQLEKTTTSVLIGVFLLVHFVTIAGLLVYSVVMTTTIWSDILLCQPNLIFFISFCMLGIVLIADFCVSCFERACPSTRVLSRLLNFVGGVCVIWWLFVGIYLSGAVRGQWYIDF